LGLFLHCTLETRWQRLGQFLNDFQNDILSDFLHENLDFLLKNFRFSHENMIFLIMHKIV